jgi:hypothetical protein
LEAALCDDQQQMVQVVNADALEWRIKDVDIFMLLNMKILS